MKRGGSVRSTRASGALLPPAVLFFRVSGLLRVKVERELVHRSRFRCVTDAATRGSLPGFARRTGVAVAVRVEDASAQGVRERER